MVYRGKPSKSCGDCRKRRTKCDQAVPACGQCIKAKRICPGYRNAVDLMFFDESQNITKKARSTIAEPSDSALTGSSRSWSHHVVPLHTTPERITDFVFYQPLGDLAVNFFMSNYVGTDAMMSQFDYLPEYYIQYGSAYSHVQHSIKAVGLAGYSQTNNRRDLMNQAMKEYTRAIREVNSTFSNRSTATDDSTLLSVMLLGMFEVLTVPRSQGLENLTKHLNGAISVASLYAKGHQTQTRRRLLTTLNQTVTMNCWIQNIALPDGFLRLRDEMGDSLDSTSSQHSKFLNIVIDGLLFMRLLKVSHIESPSVIIDGAIGIDRKLVNFIQEMPEAGRFQELRSADEDELVCNGRYHIYPRNFTAHLWNNARSCRIRAHTLVIAECRKLQLLELRGSGYATTLNEIRIKKSLAVIKQLAKEICATVPQLAGYLDQLPSYMRYRLGQEKDHENPDVPNDSPAARSTKKRRIEPMADLPQAIPSLPLMQPASLYHILYQLHALLAHEILSEDLRFWIRQRLDWIEGKADPDNLKLLKTMLKTRFTGSEILGLRHSKKLSHFEVLRMGGI
ncbi:hypothetical protein BCR34DRAFT_132745 [Clohesyomyces aquaticus]|uniref:Zn(2)-C6 fungal-type domain-containing protein n=1 Tax=Clohesyomyces aquaticus TaxID=1231657 RepID=A0A1Y2AAB4_9PLEO|nr:hypothetical protein BCR34DRAFT_132745 [Clohesyomyces aquaticus]